jgi:cell division protein FtsQ
MRRIILLVRDAGVRRRLLQATLFAMGAVGIGAVTWLGYHGVHRIPYRSLRVEAPPQVPVEEVRALIAIDTTARLFDIEPDSVARRVRRHPWARDVSVTRLPTGTLRIAVEPRRPVALMVGQDGRPWGFVDGESVRLPLRARDAHLVPLLRGLTARNFRADTLVNPVIRELTSALAGVDDQVMSICSEFLVLPSGDVRLFTVPFGKSGAIPVNLGREDFQARLKTLAAYWEQGVRTRPDHRIQQIDLRFDGQIVVQDGA